MAGVTSIMVKESLDEITERLRQTSEPIVKERLQVLYWLKQEKAPSISSIAKSMGRHRGTLQEWLRIYRTEGISGLEIVKSSPGGGRRIIPKWAEAALSKRLQESESEFASYGAVQQWLSETLGVEAEYHAVYQMTRYRLKVKLKVTRPKHYK
jgi:transposase